MQAFAACFEELIHQNGDIPTTTLRIKLPRDVEPKKIEYNIGNGDVDNDLIIVEFKVPSCSRKVSVITLSTS